MCSLAAQGLWMQLLCLMAESERPGYLLVNGLPPSCGDLGRILNVSWRTVHALCEELRRRGVSSLEEGVIFCRRMVKDAEASEIGRQSVEKRWKAKLQPNRAPNGEPNREPNTKKQKQNQKQRQKEDAERPPARARLRTRPPRSIGEQLDQIRRDWHLPTFLAQPLDDDDRDLVALQ